MSIQEMLRRSPPVRRRVDGTLYELSASQKKRCDDLCRKHCCNYYQGSCLLLEEMNDQCPCLQTLSQHIWCRWFQNAVLPLDWKLEGEIFADEYLKRCEKCGRAFLSVSGKVKYCPDCREDVRRIKTREYVARHRRKKRDGM